MVTSKVGQQLYYSSDPTIPARGLVTTMDRCLLSKPSCHSASISQSYQNRRLSPRSSSLLLQSTLIHLSFVTFTGPYLFAFNVQTTCFKTWRTSSTLTEPRHAMNTQLIAELSRSKHYQRGIERTGPLAIYTAAVPRQSLSAGDQEHANRTGSSLMIYWRYQLVFFFGLFYLQPGHSESQPSASLHHRGRPLYRAFHTPKRMVEFVVRRSIDDPVQLLHQCRERNQSHREFLRIGHPLASNTEPSDETSLSIQVVVKAPIVCAISIGSGWKQP